MLGELFIALLLQVAGNPAQFDQPSFDAIARRAAERAASGRFEGDGSQVVREDSASADWHSVTDALVRANSGYSAPPNYRYALSAKADLDKDGRMDRAEFVDNGKQGAIRVRFGNGKVQIFAKGKRRIYGEGLFAVGQNALMINYPESRTVFMYIKRGKMLAVFDGD